MLQRTQFIRPVTPVGFKSGMSRIGIPAVALPRRADGSPDWAAFESFIGRVEDAGFTPACPVDTTGKLTNDAVLNAEIVRIANRTVQNGVFVAGITAPHQPGAQIDREAIFRDLDVLQGACAIPMLMANHGMRNDIAQNNGVGYVQLHHDVGQRFGQYLLHILSTKFTPAGFVPPVEIVEEILQDPHCAGFKTSSWDLKYDAELLLLGRKYAKTVITTGHDDEFLGQLPKGYSFLLGAAGFAPAKYAELLQYLALGQMDDYTRLGTILQNFSRFVFRDPTPGYVHNLHMFLWLLGQCETPNPAPNALVVRGDEDLERLRAFAEQLELTIVN